MTESDGIQLLQSLSDAVAQLTDRISPSVVHVDAGAAGGTGIVWSNDGYIVTAGHVVGEAHTSRVVLSDGRAFEGKVVGSDGYSDVAVLKVAAAGLTPIPRGEGKNVRVGQFALSLANSFGRPVSATSGIITSRGRDIRGWHGMMIEEAIVTDAKLNPGYSGGPVVDASGEILGMNVAHFAGRGIAVPTDSLTKVVEAISKDGRVRKAFLGVVIEPIRLPEELASTKDVGQEWGLLVRSVEKGSPAKVAGVAIGDIVLRLGDSRAVDEHQLHKALSGEAVGKTVSLWILRGEELTELKVVPGEVDERQ